MQRKVLAMTFVRLSISWGYLVQESCPDRCFRRDGVGFFPHGAAWDRRLLQADGEGASAVLSQCLFEALPAIPRLESAAPGAVFCARTRWESLPSPLVCVQPLKAPATADLPAPGGQPSAFCAPFKVCASVSKFCTVLRPRLISRSAIRPGHECHKNARSSPGGSGGIGGLAALGAAAGLSSVKAECL